MWVWLVGCFACMSAASGTVHLLAGLDLLRVLTVATASNVFGGCFESVLACRFDVAFHIAVSHVNFHNTRY